MTRAQGIGCIGAYAAAFAAGAGEDPYEMAWLRQVAMGGTEYVRSAAAGPDGKVYVAGTTYLALDAFVFQYDSAGAPGWSKWLGTAQWEEGTGVAVDALGNVLVCGLTGGDLGGPNAGGLDAFVAKFDSTGATVWVRQFGTEHWDSPYDIAVDGSGNAVICGVTGGSFGGAAAGADDAFVAKIDPDGTLLWVRQVGSVRHDRAYSVTVAPDDDIVIAGYTNWSLFGLHAGLGDVFAARFSASGDLIWGQQLGTAEEDYAWSVAADATGRAVIAGWTEGSLWGKKIGGSDGMLIVLDPAGSLEWTRQFGTTYDESCYSVSVDVAGNIFTSGDTYGAFGGASAGVNDAFLAKHDATGAFRWAVQLGTPGNEYGLATAIGDGVYLAGTTTGALVVTPSGGSDAFLAKFVGSCLADCDGSGVLELQDFLCFVNAFTTGDPYADCDASGSLDLFDFLCFVNAFNAGCP